MEVKVLGSQVGSPVAECPSCDSFWAARVLYTKEIFDPQLAPSAAGNSAELQAMPSLCGVVIPEFFPLAS